MSGFEPPTPAYPPSQKGTFLVAIAEIAPVKRNPGVGIFNDSEVSARQRTVRILKGLRELAELPPIEVVKAPPGSPYRYKLTNGTHRLYCSLAAGFTHIPAIAGFDITDPYA